MRGEQIGVEVVVLSFVVIFGVDIRGVVMGFWMVGDGFEMVGECCQLCILDMSVGCEQMGIYNIMWSVQDGNVVFWFIIVVRDSIKVFCVFYVCKGVEV